MSCMGLVPDVDAFGQRVQILVWAPGSSSVDGAGSPHGRNPMPRVVSVLVPGGCKCPGFYKLTK